MAYFNGSATTLEQLRQAIFTACTNEGWTQSGDVLHKSDQYMRLQVISSGLRLLGGTGIDGTNALTGAAPNFVQIGGAGINYPLAYELFVFEYEVYVIVNYSVDRYQWAAWGKSTVPGCGGTGLWFNASQPSSLATTLSLSFAINGNQHHAALFWSNQADAFLHNNIDTLGWSTDSGLIGSDHVLQELLRVLPNNFNAESVLLPAQLYIQRASSKYSLVVNAAHCRNLRIDHYEPGQIIAIGDDRWKVFPWVRKDTTNRNAGSATGASGTFGWAIRYEGP